MNPMPPPMLHPHILRPKDYRLPSPRTILAPGSEEGTSVTTSTATSFPNGHQIMSESYSHQKMAIAFLTTQSETSIPSASNMPPPQITNYPTDSQKRTFQCSYTTRDCALQSRQIEIPLAIRRKRFVKKLTAPCPESGKLVCVLCDTRIWGPNGRYHINKCAVLSKLRAERDDGLILHRINGFEVDEEFFSQPKPLKPKKAKVPGFVMSRSVLRDNPFKAPTPEQIKKGIPVGKKGWVRCLNCNSEMHAPNTKKHVSRCPGPVANLQN